MSDTAVVFDKVCKNYPMYHHLTGGMRNMLFHLPKSIRSLRNTRYEVFHDLSFDVKKGETLGVIGKNGTGKSTILGLIAGVLRPSGGRIDVNGRVSPLLELGAGFHPELSGKENIMLNGILMGLTRQDVSCRMDEIIDFSELHEFIDQPIRVYSSGMLARLGFSVIAHLDPEILLVDEILAVGDLDFQKKCIAKMQEFKRNGITIIFVSHSMVNVQRICDRVIWLDNHSVNRIGNTNDILNEYSHGNT